MASTASSSSNPPPPNAAVEFLHLLERWSSEHLRERFPRLFQLLANLDGQNAAVILAALSSTAIASNNRNLLPEFLRNLLTDEAGNDINLTSLLTEQLGNGIYLIREYSVECLEVLQIITSAIVVFTAVRELYNIYRTFRDGENISKITKQQLTKLTVEFDIISRQMIHLESEWNRFMEHLQSGSRKRRPLRTFERSIDKVKIKIDQLVIEVGSLEVNIKGHITTLKEARWPKAIQGGFSAVAFGGNVVRLRGMLAKTASSNKLLFAAELASAAANGALAAYHLGTLVIDWTELRKLAEQLEEVQKMKADLVQFQEKIGQMKDWIAEHIDEDGVIEVASEVAKSQLPTIMTRSFALLDGA